MRCLQGSELIAEDKGKTGCSIVFERYYFRVELRLQRRDPNFQMPLAGKYDVEAAWPLDVNSSKLRAASCNTISQMLRNPTLLIILYSTYSQAFN